MLKIKIRDHCRVIRSIKDQEKKINNIAIKISEKILLGGKVLFCGNGGSAADAQHLAAELLIRLRPNKSRMPIPALSLATDTSTLTACGNDFRYDDIFLRTFSALHNKNDVLFALSTSGMSKNILKVLKEAQKKDIYSVGLYGGKGGDAKKFTYDPIIIKNNNVALIQEAHIFVSHYILECVEDLLLKKKYLKILR